MNLRRLPVLLIFPLLAACGGTKFVSTWVNPTASSQPVNWQGQKVGAFVMTALTATRNGAEEALARELTNRGAQGIAGYNLVPENELQHRDKAKKFLQDAGVVGAVVMRLVGRDLEVTQSMGTVYYTQGYYPSFWGYWGYGWNTVYMPGHMTTDTVISVETMVYSIEQDKLLWAGRSKTTNPKDVSKFIRELVEVAGKEIRKAGLVSR